MAHARDSAFLLARQLVTRLSDRARADLAFVAREVDGARLAALSEAGLLELEASLGLVLQLDRASGRVAVAHEAVRAQLLAALRREDRPLRDADPAARIRAAVAADRIADAVRLLQASGGVFFAHAHGLDAAQRVINAFPEGARAAHEALRLAEAINAMKSGNMSFAKQLLAEAHPAGEGRLAQLCRHEESVSVDFICCRLVVAVCDEEAIGDEPLSMLFRVLERLPGDASMRRGMLYNVALDAFVRRADWAMADETALRARYHFVNAGADLCVFYIELYRALIGLARGDVELAEARLADARAHLAATGAVTGNDAHLLTALEKICLYERGEPGPLSEFLLLHLEEGGFGEIWPSVAGPIIGYGARALAASATLASARAFLERWRLQQWRSQRFGQAIALAEAELLQFYGRWHAADEVAQEVAEGLGRPVASLADCVDAARIRHELCACRSALESAPADLGLAQRLETALTARGLVARQRVAILIWVGAAAVARKDWSRLRTAVGELADILRATGLVAVLGEQQTALARILTDREARRRLASWPKTAAFLREHERIADPAVRAADDAGLSRQEARILLLLAERVPNKTIARRLGLAVPTVRFHLRNLYRKLGARGRTEALRAAARQGLVAE